MLKCFRKKTRIFTQIQIPIYPEGPHFLRISGEYLMWRLIMSGVKIDDNCVWKDVTLFYILNVFPTLCKYVGNVRAYTVDNIEAPMGDCAVRI